MKSAAQSTGRRRAIGDTGDRDRCHRRPRKVSPTSPQGIRKKERKPIRAGEASSTAANVVPFSLAAPAELEAAGPVPAWEPGTLTMAKVVSAGPSAAQLPAVRNAWDVCAVWAKHVAAAQWFDDEKEMLVVLALNARGYCMHVFLVSIGTAAETLGHMREIFRPLVAAGAYSFVVAHNHPTDELEPSKPDLELLSRIRAAAEVMQIHLQDFVIVGRMDRGNALKARSCREDGAL